MNTRELIATIRACETGTPEFNALLKECAAKIEDFMGGPEEQTVGASMSDSDAQPSTD